MSSLETSITLDDVFAVVAAKRVPLAAELAGYLALEIADGTDAGSGEVDPKTVFISEEGSVALVRPKKDVITGDAEASVRTLLTRLLEAGGSSTPALGQAARRKPGNGLPALVEELEAALIPVNRAAGRRALARLSREVKRVTQGVGRNASVAPAQKPQLTVPSPPEPVKPASIEVRAPEPRPEPIKPVEARAEVDPPKHDPLAPTPVAPPQHGAPPQTPRLPSPMETGLRSPAASPAPKSIPPPPGNSVSGPPPPPPQRERPPGPASALHVPTGPTPFEPSPMPPPPRIPTPTPPPMPSPIPARAKKTDDIDALLNSFEVSGGTDDKQLARDLKGMAGLSPTPPQPRLGSIADLADEVGKEMPRRLEAGEGDSVAELLAMAEASLPAPAVTAPAHPPVAKPSTPPPGAPAILKETPARERDTPAPKSDRSKKEVFRRTSPAETADPAAKTQRRATAAEPPRAPKTSMALLIMALVGLAAATVAIYKYAPHVFVGHKPLSPPTASGGPATPLARPAQCKLTLTITDAPPRSEILLRVGQAPVDIDHMPVGARLELVATAEGYAPRRAVIAAEAQWDKGADGKPRIEVPIQLDGSKPKPGQLDPWPGAEPNSQVGGSGAPGTVHVVSNVRGAEIWLLAGLGPEAKMEQKCEGDIDVLVASPNEKSGAPGPRKRVHVKSDEVAAAAPDSQGNKTFSVSATR